MPVDSRSVDSIWESQSRPPEAAERSASSSEL